MASCSSYESTINQYFTDVAAASGSTDNVYSVATQYSNIEYSETFAGSYVDGTPFPTPNACHDGFDKYCVTDSQLQTEIEKVAAHNGWPTQSQTALYFIFTPANVGVCFLGGSPSSNNPCTTNVFCGYHSAPVTNAFAYAVVPDDAAVLGDACATEESPAGNGADDTLSTVSHETMEAITDPFLNGWWTEDSEAGNEYFQGEIGDLCGYNYGAPLGTTLSGQAYNQVINGHDYYLQQEYSNADGGCVQSADNHTVTKFASNDPRYAGVGPLVYHDGPVMTTNTVYAIYWVPAAPANKRLPTISGTPKVGKKLTVSRGLWSYLPKFTYRWLRCSSAGTSCTGISKATGSSYTLVKTDAHHRIEVRVTATNPGGSAREVTAPTAAIRP